jgi:hypothetical protein
MRRYGLVDIPETAEDIDAVPIGRTLTINGTTYDLSANRSWTISGTNNNIYNTDGTLTGNRTLTLSSYSLTFAGTTSTRFFSNGNVGIGTTGDIGFRLNVVGQAGFGDISGSFVGVIAYQASSATRLGIFTGKIWHTNGADGSIWFDAGGTTTAGSQPFRIYTEEFATIPYKFPLCLQGNGYETIFGEDTITTNASSLVTMVSTTKGFLPPRMNATQRASIASPATGLIVYQTDGSAGLYVRNSGSWQLLGSGGGGGGTGTVTSVSVVTANGFSGIVTNDTTTPAITMRTTITGLLKGNGTAISAATVGTDYQAPISLTTTGTSGAATFSSNTLNIPQYQGQLSLTTTGSSGPASFIGTTLNIPNYTSAAPTSDGTYTPTISSLTNCGNFTTYTLHFFEVGNVVHVAGKITFSPSNTTDPFGFKMSIPVNMNLSTDYYCGGTCVRELNTTGATVSAGSIQGGGNNLVEFFFATANSTAITDWFFTYTYYVGGL